MSEHELTEENSTTISFRIERRKKKKLKKLSGDVDLSEYMRELVDYWIKFNKA